MKPRWGSIFLTLAALSAMGFLIAPLVVVVSVSFTSGELMTFPPDGFSLRWYRALAENPQFLNAAFLSFQLALATAALATAIGTTAALAIHRHRFVGRGLVYALTLSPLMLPQLILALALLIYLSQLGLSGSFGALLIGHVLVTMPFVVRLVLVALERIDPNIERAAAVAGASPVTVFFKVTLWLIFPGVFAGAIFAFIMSFDNIVISIFFTTSRLVTLPVEIYEYLEYADDPMITAISSVVILGIVAILVIIEKTVGFTKSFAAVEHAG